MDGRDCRWVVWVVSLLRCNTCSLQSDEVCHGAVCLGGDAPETMEVVSVDAHPDQVQEEAKAVQSEKLRPRRTGRWM